MISTTKHAHFTPPKKEENERKRVLTMKYGKQQIELIRKRLRVEGWLVEALEELCASDATTPLIDIDVDEMLDIEGESERRKWMQDQLKNCNASREHIQVKRRTHMKRQHRSRYYRAAKYSPMERVVAVVVDDEEQSQHTSTNTNPAGTASSSSFRCHHSSQQGHAAASNGKKARIASVEKTDSSSDAFVLEDLIVEDTTTVHDSSPSAGSFQSYRGATCGDDSSISTKQPPPARDRGDSIFSTRDSSYSTNSIGDYSVPLSHSSSTSVRDSIRVSNSSSLHDSSSATPIRTYVAEQLLSDSKSCLKYRMDPSGEKGDYRLSIYIGDEDDTPPTGVGNGKTQNGDTVVINRDRKISAAANNKQTDREWSGDDEPDRAVTNVDQQRRVSTVLHESTYDNAPTIKLSALDQPSSRRGSSQPPQNSLSLELEKSIQDCLACTPVEGLSPVPRPRTSSAASSIGRRTDNGGSSTPRLRISTPKATSPVTTPDDGIDGHAPPSQNGDSRSTAAAAKAQEVEKKPASELRSGPSSRRTVVMIAGLFVVGLILIFSGIIVLSVEEHPEFQITGGIFLGLGIVFFIICLVLQKKNVKKLVNELEKDLFFLNVTDNKVWNFIFHFDEQLAWTYGDK